MSNAKKCDRCGWFYEAKFGEGIKYISPYNIEGVTHGKDIDLCDKCAENFKEWLEYPASKREESKEELTNAVECKLENITFKPRKSAIITPDMLDDEYKAKDSEICTDDDNIHDILDGPDKIAYNFAMNKNRTSLETLINYYFLGETSMMRSRIVNYIRRFFGIPSTMSNKKQLEMLYDKSSSVGSYRAIMAYKGISKDTAIKMFYFIDSYVKYVNSKEEV